MKGYRISTHDSVSDLVQKIFHYAGYRSKREQNGMFVGNTRGIGELSRGDLTISNFGHRPLLLDFRITSCYPANGGVLSDNDINNEDLCQSNLKKHFDLKNNHYKDAAEEMNIDFLPCIIDIGGQLQQSFKILLKKVLKVASETRNIPFSILWNYWISALLVTLQKGRAKAVIGLGMRTLGSGIPDSYDTSDQVVSRSSYINCN
jgi:hypothetical protein